MKWAHFLHIYQPADQHPGTLEKIVNESYRPLLKGFLRVARTKVTLNINGTLTEKLFGCGYRDVIEDIKILSEMGRLELTGSAKYHAFLPLLPESEIRRQVILNDETNSKYFGNAYKPQGFFSPEMAYSPKVALIAKKLGYKWILADETSVSHVKRPADNSKIYKIKGVDMQVYFREKNPSNMIMGALVRTSSSLKKAMGSRMETDSYVVTAMDGETFGHHRPGLDEGLLSVLESKDFDNVLISDLPKYFKEEEEIIPKDSNWASSIKDVNEGNSFNLWFDKKNKIHEYEWQLATLAIRVVNDSAYSDKKYPRLLQELKDYEDLSSQEKQGELNKQKWIEARDMLDKGLGSDPMWWASAKPWWSIEMIEKGMSVLWKVVRTVPDASDKDKDCAEEYYKKILFLAHEWQRKGVVDVMAKEDSKEKMIPLSKRFAATAHYHALLDALNLQEKKAASKREYEQAIKWRDAQIKLKKDLDIYDAVHIMDVFREKGDFKKFEKFLKKYRQEYRIISKGQP